MKPIKRTDITEPLYQEIFKKESHHNHEIIIDEQGTYRWKKDEAIDFLVSNLDFNKLIRQLLDKGYDKNSEVYRAIYRGIGYSLSGYWEIFYWEANNEDAELYRNVSENKKS